ncbi:MAG: HD domain-containing protein, partial [Dehalococcoidia bacterium]
MIRYSTNRRQAGSRMPAEQSGAAPSIPIFSAHAEAKAAEALNVLIFAHGGGGEPIHEEQLATLRWSLTGLVDCLFPINGDYADFGGVDSLDGIDYVHPTRVAALAVVIGRMLDMRRSELISLAMAAALMNVGYLALRRSLLDQPRRLLEGEWEEHIHTHPGRGTALLAQAGLFDDSLRAIEQHHERWDGSGYPAGATGGAISRSARILAVADTYVSLRSVRPHRPPVDAEPALEEIAAGRGKLFDPDVIDAFEDVIARFSGAMRPSRAGTIATTAAVAASEEHSAAQRDGSDAIDTAANAAAEPAYIAADEDDLLP